MQSLKTWGPMTVLVVAVALIVVLVGAFLVVTGNYNEQFRKWVDDLVVLAIASGLLGVGRGIAKNRTEIR